MASYKVIQLRRGNTLQTESFIGADGEITIDTDKHCVVVHDGHTVGGFPLKVEAVEYTRPRYLTYRAAIVQQGVAGLGFSTSSNPPMPVAVTETSGIVTGIARFFAEESVQDHFMLPEDWVAPLSLDVIWRTSGTIGQVGWQFQVCNIPVGGSLENAVFGTPHVISSTGVGVSGTINSTTFAIPSSTFSPTDEIFYQLSRSFAVGEAMLDPVDLLSLRFTVLTKGK